MKTDFKIIQKLIIENKELKKYIKWLENEIDNDEDKPNRMEYDDLD